MTLLNWSHGLPNCTTDMLEHRVTTASLYTGISCNTYCLVNLPMFIYSRVSSQCSHAISKKDYTFIRMVYLVLIICTTRITHQCLDQLLNNVKTYYDDVCIDHENCQAYEYTVSKRLTSIPNKLFFIFVWAKMAN